MKLLKKEYVINFFKNIKFFNRSGFSETRSFQLIRNYFLILFLLLLPAILYYFFITIFGVNVVVWDSWERIPLLDHFYKGTLTFNDLFAQHNEHRILFFNIIFLILIPLTHWNAVMEMYLSWILIIFNCLLIFYLYARYWGISKNSLIKFLPVPWLLFSFRQWESTLIGDQYCVYLCIFGFVISIVFIELSHRIDYKFGIAIVGGIVSTFSFFNGLLIWPIGLLFIFLTKEKKNVLLSLWGLTGAAIYCIYFFNWIKPTHHPSIFYIIENPIAGIEYFFANVGSPLGYDLLSSFTMGLLLVAILVYASPFLLKYKSIRQNAIWLSFICFSLGSSLMTTLGRSGFGVIQAISPRYVSFTMLGVVGVYLLILSLEGKNGVRKAISNLTLGIVIGLIMFGILCGFFSGIESAGINKDYNEKLTNYLVGYSSATDEQLIQLHPDPNIVRERAKSLEQYHLNVFYSPDNKFILNKPSPVQIFEGQPFLTGSGKIAGENKYILFEHPLVQNKSMISFEDVPITTKSVLYFDIALDPRVWSPEKGDGVLYQVYVNNLTPENLIFSRYIDPKHNVTEQRWNSHQVDLSPYSGNTTRLIFSTSPGPANDGTYDWAWWGDPRIVTM